MSLKLVALMPGVPTCVQLVDPSGERSTMKPVSLDELSTHVRLICAYEAAVATSVVGAVGGVDGAVSAAVSVRLKLISLLAAVL